MSELRFTLLSEGSSDRALVPILLWTLRQHSPLPFQPQWADLRRLPNPPRSLPERVQASLDLYPCDLLFIHRDGDRAGVDARQAEILAALPENVDPPVVTVVPVRTQEAWLLFEESAIRRAAGNPNGRAELDLPPLATLEQVPDPKQRLFDSLQRATELNPRRRRRLSLAAAVHRIADLVEDFQPLRTLPAFQAFESTLQRSIREQGWDRQKSG